MSSIPLGNSVPIVQPDSLTVATRKLWLQNVIYNLKNHIIPALAAFLANSLSRSLAPLQRIPLSLPSGVVRIRVRRRRPPLALTSAAALPESPAEVPERCVNCTVLHEPEGSAVADVIFIHGLHGGLDRTWTQGTWRQTNPNLKDLRPVRRRSTGNLYVPVDAKKEDGRFKRTLSRIYTTIPVKIARKYDLNQPDIEVTVANNQNTSDDDNEEEENFSRCWPKDWLPQDCPGIRVLAINYTTDKLWRPLWQKATSRTNLRQRSEEMTEELLRFGVGSRPIVWVGHSKGGLYIKQIILNGSRAADQQENVRNLFTQTKGIMFYSVPHKGSPIADMTFPFFKRSIEVLEIQSNCEFVINLHRKFLEVFQDRRPEIFSFIDTENTPVGFTSFKFIAYDSADPNIGIKCDVPLNHREICKPAGRDCFLYLELVKLIDRVIFDKDVEL